VADELTDLKKDELVEKAEEAGLDASGKTKEELVEELRPLETSIQPEPVPEQFKQVGKIVAVDPQTEDEIPESGLNSPDDRREIARIAREEQKQNG
jgi:hypothetical protein